MSQLLHHSDVNAMCQELPLRQEIWVVAIDVLRESIDLLPLGKSNQRGFSDSDAHILRLREKPDRLQPALSPDSAGLRAAEGRAEVADEP